MLTRSASDLHADRWIGGHTEARPQNMRPHNVLLMTFDTLRYDVAARSMASGQTPNLNSLIPDGWQLRHSPASFTFAAHASFFAGFLPTPPTPGPHERLLALRFAGSESIGPRTCVLEGPDIVSGLRERGYRSICVGGTGFFNPESPLGRVLPNLFDEAHWSPEMGVSERHSTEHQVRLASERLNAQPQGKPIFLFVNISALHQPNSHYLPGAKEDCIESQAAALCYVDGEIRPLADALVARGPTLAILCSDHGTLYGEDGHRGHRVGHRAVWDVPYAEAIWEAS